MDPSNLHIDEFTSCIGDVTLFYQILRLEGSVYVWVGTEAGNMGGLVAAYGSRLRGSPPAVSTVLGPAGEGLLCHLAERLQRRTGQNILLSANLPDEALSLHVEEQLVGHLSA